MRFLNNLRQDATETAGGLAGLSVGTLWGTLETVLLPTYLMRRGSDYINPLLDRDMSVNRGFDGYYISGIVIGRPVSRAVEIGIASYDILSDGKPDHLGWVILAWGANLLLEGVLAAYNTLKKD